MPYSQPNERRNRSLSRQKLRRFASFWGLASLLMLSAGAVAADSPDSAEKDKALVPVVCIFDVDNTLTHAGSATAEECPNTEFDNDPPPNWPANSGTNNWVHQAIETCLAKGYHLAIATAETGTEAGTGGASNPKQRTFLKSLAPEVFTDAFFDSPAFQTSCSAVTSDMAGKEWCLDNEFGHKQVMLIEILNYYDITPTYWGYSIFFDDELPNLTAGNELGLQTVQSSPNCGGAYCDRGCGILQGGLRAITDRPSVAEVLEQQESQ